MWIFDSDYNRWKSTDDSLVKNEFDFYQQELQVTRYYSKCLSGASYIPVNDLNNIYDILGSYQERNWYVGVLGSSYSNSLIPSRSPSLISSSSSIDYSKYLSEYGLTLKNLFTPKRLIRDSINNYVEVDVATTEEINIFFLSKGASIDGVSLKEGHRVLVKDQKSIVTLPNNVDPKTFFKGNFYTRQIYGATIEYEFFNQENGIYKFTNGSLLREADLDSYENCKRYSVLVKLGDANFGKQFHVSRLLNGYFPIYTSSEPFEFIEKKNWMIRNKVDYNNLFEINYYDTLKHGEQSYFLEGVTYSIPERTIAIGEFGIIHNNQNGISNIIRNKYKVNLRSISQTSTHYWICGDKGILLKVRKHDFFIEKIKLELDNNFSINLKSLSFFNDLRGVVVGDLNSIYITTDGGYNWKRLKINDFSSFYYNKVVFRRADSFFIAGNAGVFIEMKEDINGWSAFKRRISRFVDDDDEYLLVDNINDMYYTSVNSWGLSFSYSTQSIATDKELLFLVTDDSKVIVYDINDSIGEFDFVYLEFPRDYDDIINITNRKGTNTYYFTGLDIQSGDSGIFSFNLSDFQYIGVGNSYSNTIMSSTFATYESSYFPNEIYDHNGDQLLICGNTSLLEISTYSTSFSFDVLDSTFEQRLKSKLLYLDYDAGSKLNFFNDFGEYRMPNSLTFSSASFSSTSYLGFSQLIYGATAPSFVTQSETNWWTYWTDRQVTFEYYSNAPMIESSKVLISPTFSYTATQSMISISSITTSYTGIKELAPNVGNIVDAWTSSVQSRFNGSGPGLTAISGPLNSYDIYLYDYLMVVKVDSTYLVKKGDVMHFESSYVSGDFIVNKIETLNSAIGTWKYIYLFTEFNGNIVKNLQSLTSSITNLNSYSSVSEFNTNFNLHPISHGYNLTLATSSGIVEIEPKFNNLTSYYNLATNINLNGDLFTMSYTDGFLKFGYTPTYNILDYLEGLNDINDPSPTFYGDKEYYAMPEYIGIPLDSLTFSTAYIDTNGYTFSYSSGGSPVNAGNGNKILFGGGLKLEWESIFVDTFVDVVIYNSTVSYKTDKLLVTKKYLLENYQDLGQDFYVIEFHKNINYKEIDPSNPHPSILGNFSLDIKSRRKLSQISEDLKELNNIQRPGRLKEYTGGNDVISWSASYLTYERELNFKIPTDSYAKILLSDVETIETLTGILYIDNKNELSLNITRLEQELSIPISNTANFSGNLFIYCSQKHGLKTNDGVVLEFNGGTYSSEYLNQQYFGYHSVNVVNEYNFYIDIPYGTVPLVGKDSGFVKYVKQDPFLNYEPVDLIDVGVDKKGKQSIELSIENTILNGSKYSLRNVDFNKLRFRLIDGLDIETLSMRFPWILEAEISGATIGINDNNLVWYKGIWECGRWFGGRWVSGSWVSGDWYGGIWDSKSINDNILSVEINEKSSDLSNSVWYSGRWFDGTWNNGLWVNGRWYGGTWNNGLWYKGIWNDGTWNNGLFTGGIWVLGTWNNGIFNTDNEPSYWLDGKWFGGDFENGMWYNGTWDEATDKESRFGVKSYNSRTSTWHGGKWINGSFHSKLNLNDSGIYDVADTHKYSIWYTGQWYEGDFYGGIAYNIDFKSGIWHGGVLEDIQIIGITGSSITSENYFTLNGIFKFNIGDEITIIDNQVGGLLSQTFGSNDNPVKYKVLYTVEDSLNKWTKVYVNKQISLNYPPALDLRLRVVSRFRNCNWKSGIWTNGIYEDGIWEGGIWYNGVFEAVWM